jgi:hypothetical protein
MPVGSLMLPCFVAEAQALAHELLKYRAAYRTNSADWDDMERKLVVELAKLK